jgi:hypothetical protein
MRPTTQTLLGDLQSVQLLGRLGQPHSLPHQSVGSWHEALKLCHSETWNALQLMTKNRHAGQVNRLNWGRFQDWNPVCAELRPEVAKIVDSCLARVRETHKVTTDLQNTLSWDLLGLLLEREFDDVTPPAFSLIIIFPIYKAGHFPCGWTGPKLDTDWSSGSKPLPAGEVLIY